MINYLRHIGLMMTIGLLMACTEEISMDIPQGQTRLVVDGIIELDYETNETMVRVQLSTTVAYFNDADNPALIGADVTIYDDWGSEFPLTETSPGLYTSSDIQGFVYETYRLIIEWNGESYMAESTLEPVPQLEDIYQITQDATFFDDAGIKLAIDFQDPAEEENFYHFEQYRNDTLLITPSNGNQFQLVVRDEFFNGQYIESYVPGDEFSFLPGDMGKIKMRSLDEWAFNFYKLFYEKSVDEPSFIVGETPSVAIKGNVLNTTSPENYGLGFFLATQVSTRSTRITTQD